MKQLKQESHAVARKLRDAAAILFGLKFTNNIHCKFKTIQASKTRLQSCKHTGAKQNFTQNFQPVLNTQSCGNADIS